MPSNTELLRLEHIRDNIRLIRIWTERTTFEAFQANRERLYAVIRALEVVSEASRHLTEPTKAHLAHLPWRDIADAGNFYRHEYQSVRAEILWRTIQEDLPPLLAAVEAELAANP